MLDLHNLSTVAEDNINWGPGSNNDVTRLNVGVKESLLMQILHGLPNLEHDLQGLFTFEASGVVMNSVLKTTPSTELHDKDIGGWIMLVLTVFDELDDLGLHKYMVSYDIQHRNT